MMVRHPLPPILGVILLAVVLACGGSFAPTATPTAAPGATPSATPRRTPAAPPTASPLARLEAARLALGAPGVIAVLEVDGTRTFLRSGSADLDGTALGEATRFRIASITKPIIAALVLDAVARGELGLDDPVATHLPGVLRTTPVVTVRQLLDHSSGIFDEGNEGDPVADLDRLPDGPLREEGRRLVARYEAGDAIVASAALIVALAETHPRAFEPGTGFHYSNVNYQVAGMVLEAVTGRTLADLLRARIVEPLGLRRTTLAPADARSPELRGYVKGVGDAAPVDVTDDLTLFGNGGNGGIVSTPDELLTMLRAIVAGDLLPDALASEMRTARRASYGLGLGVSALPCGTFFGHGGLVNGTQSIALVAGDGGDGVVIALDLVGGADPGLPRLAASLLCEE